MSYDTTAWSFTTPEIQRRFSVADREAEAQRKVDEDLEWFPVTTRFAGALAICEKRMGYAMYAYVMVVRAFGDLIAAREYVADRTRRHWQYLLAAHDRFMRLVQAGEPTEEDFYSPEDYARTLMTALVVDDVRLVEGALSIGTCPQMDWRRIGGNDKAGWGAMLLAVLTGNAGHVAFAEQYVADCMKGQRRYRPMKAVLDLTKLVFSKDQAGLDKHYEVLEKAYKARDVDGSCYLSEGFGDSGFDLISSLLLRLAVRNGMRVEYDSPVIPGRFIHASP